MLRLIVCWVFVFASPRMRLIGKSNCLRRSLSLIAAVFGSCLYCFTAASDNLSWNSLDDGGRFCVQWYIFPVVESGVGRRLFLFSYRTDFTHQSDITNLTEANIKAPSLARVVSGGVFLFSSLWYSMVKMKTHQSLWRGRWFWASLDTTAATITLDSEVGNKLEKYAAANDQRATYLEISGTTVQSVIQILSLSSTHCLNMMPF